MNIQIHFIHNLVSLKKNLIKSFETKILFYFYGQIFSEKSGNLEISTLFQSLAIFSVTPPNVSK